MFYTTKKTTAVLQLDNIIVIVYKLCFWIKLCKNTSLLVVFGGREEGHLTFMLRQGFP